MMYKQHFVQLESLLASNLYFISELLETSESEIGWKGILTHSVFCS